MRLYFNFIRLSFGGTPFVCIGMEQVETKLARLRDLWNNRELDAIINLFYSEESVLIAPGPDNVEGLEGFTKRD